MSEHHLLQAFEPKLLFKAILLWSLTALAALCLGTSAQPASSGSSTGSANPEKNAVKVTTQREGDVTRFYVDNQELCEVTMTFDMGLVNLKSDTHFPFTLTFPPHQKTEAFALSPVECSAKWSYDYTNYYKLGSNCAQHDDAYLYQLPFLPGTKFKVTQGYNGRFSHTGSNQYATDFQMPEGTLVCAARGGVVVRVKDDSDRGGSSMDYDHYNNYVLIRHDDGTLAHYCHLQKGGVVVKPGQLVGPGQIIAHSGNTGFSSGPHLHFCVFKTKNGRERVSLPVKFRTAAEEGITLVSGRAYKAAEIHSASARTKPTPDGAM